jgi:ParB-like chromosome segregation protein Spo0J
MKIDKEFSKMKRPLDDCELAGLEESIKKHGCLNPLVIWQEKDILLDGHARHEICTRLGIPYSVWFKSLPSRPHAKKWILEEQLNRRNLSLDSMACNEVKLRQLLEQKSLEEDAKTAKDKKT